MPHELNEPAIGTRDPLRHENEVDNSNNDSYVGNHCDIQINICISITTGSWTVWRVVWFPIRLRLWRWTAGTVEGCLVYEKPWAFNTGAKKRFRGADCWLHACWDFAGAAAQNGCIFLGGASGDMFIMASMDRSDDFALHAMIDLNTGKFGVRTP